jgi:hypothetical protein
MGAATGERAAPRKLPHPVTSRRSSMNGQGFFGQRKFKTWYRFVSGKTLSCNVPHPRLEPGMVLAAGV